MKAPPLDVLAALEDDLNTPMAMSHLHEALRALNTAATTAEKAHWKAVLLADGKLLGLLLERSGRWLKGRGGRQRGADSAWIEAQIAARVAARKAQELRRGRPDPQGAFRRRHHSRGRPRRNDLAAGCLGPP